MWRGHSCGNRHPGEHDVYGIRANTGPSCCCCCALYHLLRRFCVREAAACIFAPLTLQQTVVTASVRSETQARFPPSIKSYFQPVNLKKSDNAPHLAAHGLWLAYSISYVLDCISTASCTRSAASSARLGTRRRRCSTSRRRAWRGSTSSQRAGAREAERLGYQLLVTW